MTFDELKEKAHSLPLKPGVYIMQDAQSTVIYVGKAKALKNRVSQYFQDSASTRASNSLSAMMTSKWSIWDTIALVFSVWLAES